MGDTPITLVVHDWGGLVGLLWASRNRDRVTRLVVCNTGLYRAGGRMSDAWWAFRDHVETLDAFPVADMVDGACLSQLSPEVRAAYEAPFPDPSFHGGPLALPLLVPTSDDAPGAAEGIAAWEVLEAWDDPVRFIWGERDPVLPPKIGQRMADLIPGTDQFLTVEGSHFRQEDAGTEIGQHIAAFIAATR